MKTPIVKIIKITSCSECPYHGTCKAWKKLTKSQKVCLTYSNSTPRSFILSACHLTTEDKQE